MFGSEGALGLSGLNESVLLTNPFDTFGVFEGGVNAEISGRVGFAAGQFLVYGKAGLPALNGTFGVLDENLSGATVDARTNMTLAGLSYGGAEFMPASNWAIRVEYG